MAPDRTVGDDPVLLELREQTKWLRFLALRSLPDVLDATLKESVQRTAYELSDGTRSTRAIGELAGVSPKTISNWWQRWASVGIATTDASGRGTRIASLRSLGIDVELPAEARPTPEKSDE
jgi:hypothetical protein